MKDVRKRLWAPWRMTYIGKLDQEDGCFLCQYLKKPKSDRQHLVLSRGRETFTVMNRFPYANGHLLVAVNRHEGSLAALTASEQTELMQATAAAQELLDRTVHAHGYNIGINVGRCAGAGILNHLHVHIVPRWEGDTNFMPLFADVKIIPQALEELYGKLRKNLRKR